MLCEKVAYAIYLLDPDSDAFDACLKGAVSAS